MKPVPASGVDQVGVNILRIVTGTYFMAVALDLIEGFDPTALFRSVIGATAAEITGAILLLTLSIWFMLGAALRIASLSLALFVLFSSFVSNFIAGPVENLSAFWYDLTLACAVLLSYLTLDPRDLKRASVIGHNARMRRIGAHRAVKPRRVAPEDKATGKPVSRRPRPANKAEDARNIFANI